MWRCIGWVVCACWLLWARPSAAQVSSSPAQSTSENVRYDDLIHQAIVEFDNSHWVEARALFKRAHELNKSARTWRGLGVTAFELRRYVDALHELESSLSEPNKPLTPKQRQEVEGLIVRARGFVALLTVRRKPANLTFTLDSQPAQLSGNQLSVDPGDHKIVARAAGYEERTMEMRVEPGQRSELVIELTRPVVATTVVPAERELVDTPAAPPPKRKRPLTWTFAGATAAALISATALRIVAGQESEDYSRCTDDDCAALRKRGRRHERAANVLWGVAGGLATISVVSFFLEGKPRTEVAASATAQSFELSLAHQF